MSKPWLAVERGELIGRDSRETSVAELNEWGHSKRPILQAIRDRCLDCCVDQPGEVRKCVSVKCASWPYRMGTNPFTGIKGNAEVLKRAHSDRSDPSVAEPSAPLRVL